MEPDPASARCPPAAAPSSEAPRRAEGLLLLALREQQAFEREAAVPAPEDPADACDPCFQIVFQGSGLGIALVGTDWKPLTCNPALQAMLGYSDAELAAMTFPEITHPDDRAADLALHRQLLDGRRKGYRVDKRYVAKGGRIVHARLTVALIPGDESHVLGMVEDMSAAWATERERDGALRDLRARVRELTAVQGASRILQEEALGLPESMQAVVGLLPAAFERSGSTVARLTTGGRAYETPGFTAAVATLHHEFGVEGGPRGALDIGCLDAGCSVPGASVPPEERILLHTIGGLIVASLVRRLAQERLDLAVSAGKVQVWEWDIPSGRIAWPGRIDRSTGEGQFGRAASIDVFLALVLPADRPIVLEAIREALEDPASGGRYRAEFRAVDGGGRTCWHTASGQVYWDAEGNPERMLGVATEVTERHALEESLRQALKMESIGRLAGGISHDFNNILTTILGFAELATLAVPEKGPVRGYLAEVTRAGEMAAGLVRQLLAFARRQELKPVPVDLGTILSGMGGMLSRLLKGSIEVRFDVAEGVPPAMADPSQVQQVVLNLSLNARDAMPEGGILTLRARSATRAPAEEAGAPGPVRDWAVLEVADTGTGMTPEVRARLFEPFFTTKPEGKGTGLGLATVHGIVHQSGGFIEVESAVGVGTLFRVHLPTA